ncbi:six-hairpin glycosidase [Chitinophagaceae bacterium LWZ2-11]
MKKKLLKIVLFVTCACLGNINLFAQEIKVPDNLPTEHPRLLTHGNDGKIKLQRTVADNADIKKIYNDVVTSLQPYVQKVEQDSTWLLSRLQMYWKSHYTDVFIKNGVYQNGAGKAPVPTVRFNGTRDAVCNYFRPKLEDVKPYMDEGDKLYLQNRSLPGQQWEWVEQSKSATIVESINRQIIELARDAAFLYWYTGNEKYGKLAFDVFDTYMTGIYYRNEPVDLNHGHDQTLVGYQTFEVIHEDIVVPLSIGYDFLYEYIQQHAADKMPLYKETFSKWADIIIRNGVPFNNWDLIEARFVAYIAFILEDDNTYADKKGSRYFLNRILNINATRQWSLKDLMAYGFDENTGVWNECPGYSQNVVADFSEFIRLFDKTLQTDIQPAMPRVTKAIEALPQYLFPNGYVVGFGDTHYGRLRTSSIEDMIRNAQNFGKKDQEVFFTKELKMVRGFNNDNNRESVGRGLNALFLAGGVILNDTIKAAEPNAFMAPLFYAPNVSWLAQRSGYNPQHALMISQAGSLGNHMHANGIAMELYGKGVVLAPEGGIGTSYLSGDYAEYYSQFPAHNTVCVNGISAYPVMKSNHGFEVKGSYPASNQKTNYFPKLTYSNVYFLEPETNSDQQRVMGIIRTSDTTGFYIDIFRSKRKNGKDKYHDYIYHNIGQEVNVTDTDNKLLALTKTDKPSFADVNIMGFDYWYNNKSIITAKDFKAVFKLGIPGKDSILMNMWMKGDENREVFSVMAPKSTAYGRDGMLPQNIEELPLPTIMVRQNGEAWTHPFAAVYEPASSTGNSSVKKIKSFNGKNASADFVGLEIENKSGEVNYVFSSINKEKVEYMGSNVQADYAVVSIDNKKLRYLFMGKGLSVENNEWGIKAGLPATAALTVEKSEIWFTADRPVVLFIPEAYLAGASAKALQFSKEGKTITIKGIRKTEGAKVVYAFDMPLMDYGNITFK